MLFRDDYTILLEEKVTKLQERLNNFVNKRGQELVNGTSIATHHRSSLSPSVSASPARSSIPHDPPSTSSTVSILNTDPNSDSAAPQSFSVVSSLLQDTFWGRNDNSSIENVESPTVGDGVGILPDYNFKEYLKIRPIDIPDAELGQKLIKTYLDVQGKFSFLDRNFICKLHDERNKRPTNLDDPTYRFNSFLLFAVYAASAIVNINSGERLEGVEPLRYYSTALRHAKLCKSKDSIQKIKALLICAIFQMRTDMDNGSHFDMVTRSMRLCVEVGLHKGEGFEELTLYEQEMRKRLFWCVYGLERLYSISTGRLFALEEKEISISFPVDLEQEDLVAEKIRKARAGQVTTPKQPTHFSFTLYVWTLRRLESDMVTNIYRSDSTMPELFSKVDYYLDALRTWKTQREMFTNNEQNMADIGYSKAVRLLLQPFLASLDPNGPLFKKCVTETGRICTVFREFYRTREFGYTTIAMHTNFIAGLTLIYCLWLSKDADYLPIFESIRVCTSSLYVLTERSRLCKNYRDTFENLVSATIKHVIENSQQRNNNRASLVSSIDSSKGNSIFKNIASGLGSDVSTTPPIGSDIKPDVNILNSSLSSLSELQQQQQQQQQQQGQWQQQPNATTAWNANKGWLDNYGYDDTMYNMIQDISSWTKYTGDPAALERNQPSDYMWMNFTDFSLS